MRHVAKPVPTYLPMVFNKTLDADGYMKFAAGSAAKVLVDSEDTRGKENPVLPLVLYKSSLHPCGPNNNTLHLFYSVI